jgi:predicted ATPase
MIPLLNFFHSVRSFDNIRSETIQFHTPLTLIVGHNGSGKTVRKIFENKTVSSADVVTDHHRVSQVCYDGSVAPKQ